MQRGKGRGYENNGLGQHGAVQTGGHRDLYKTCARSKRGRKEKALLRDAKVVADGSNQRTSHRDSGKVQAMSAQTRMPLRMSAGVVVCWPWGLYKPTMQDCDLILMIPHADGPSALRHQLLGICSYDMSSTVSISSL